MTAQSPVPDHGHGHGSRVTDLHAEQSKTARFRNGLVMVTRCWISSSLRPDSVAGLPIMNSPAGINRSFMPIEFVVPTGVLR